jgi:Fe2+ or Zn2+ uptake regulation protein
MQTSFFNTTAEDKDTTRACEIKAGTQNARVLEIFKSIGKGLTPADVHRIYSRMYPVAPITSIRRAITTLTDRGHLIMTGDKRQGDYGRNNRKWIIS